jgi:hypothetical protein
VKFVTIALLMACCVGALAQRYDVKILDRQDNETDYSYVVPGHFSSSSNASANCFGSDNSVNCSAWGQQTA